MTMYMCVSSINVALDSTSFSDHIVQYLIIIV